MTYVETLRVRRVLLVYSIIVVTLALIAMGAILSSPEHGISFNDNAGAHNRHDKIPLSALLVFAGYVAAIIGSIIGANLGGERANVSQAWTKPVTRERFALSYIGIDVLGVLAAFCVMLAAELLTLSVIGATRYVTLDDYLTSALLLGLGVAFAFFGVVQALAVGIGRGGVVAGVIWPVGIILVGLAALHLPVAIHDVIVALNFLNPVAYLTSIGSGEATSILPVSFSVRLALVWLLAAASCVAAVVIWKRLED